MTHRSVRRSHYGINTEEVHYHQDRAKYWHAPAPKVKPPDEIHDHYEPWIEYHDHKDVFPDPEDVTKNPDRLVAHLIWYHDAKPAGEIVGGHSHIHPPLKGKKLADHIEHSKEHKGDDRVGPHKHAQPSRPDPAVHLAMRLDMHPDAVKKFHTATVVFYNIEGCLKADSILGTGHAVFSVPAVGQWDAEELPQFIKRYLKGKTVVVVPDADWRSKPEVVTQARLCQSMLSDNDQVERVLIAAAPLDGKDRPMYGNKGIDDHIGDTARYGREGGRLEDMQTISNYLPEERRVDIKDFIMSKSPHRGDRLEHEIKALKAMALFAGPEGECTLSLRMLANVVREQRGRTIGKSTADAIRKDLENYGAIRRIGDDPALGVDRYTRSLIYQPRRGQPGAAALHFIVDEQFRALEDNQDRLGDRIDLEPPPPWYTQIKAAGPGARLEAPVFVRERLARIPGVKDADAFRRTYADVRARSSPNGIRTTDPDKAHYQVTCMTLEWLKNEGLFEGDPVATAKQVPRSQLVDQPDVPPGL